MGDRQPQPAGVGKLYNYAVEPSKQTKKEQHFRNNLNDYENYSTGKSIHVQYGT